MTKCYCNECAHCTKMEISTYPTEDGIIIEEWYCLCNIDSTWIELENEAACPMYYKAENRL